MSGVSKFTADRNQRILLDILSKPGNDVCADCKARSPRWASHNLGIFICMNCASVHRKIGTHITKVKSVTMDSWSREQVEAMKSIGNIASNAKYNPNEARHPPPANREESERDSELEKFIRWKYEFKRFMDTSGTSSTTPPASSRLTVPSVRRPQSTPIASMARRSSPLPPLPTASQPNPTPLSRPSEASSSTSSSAAPPPVPKVAPLWQPSAPSQVSVVEPAAGGVVPAWVPTPAPLSASAPASALQPNPSNPALNHPVWDDIMSLAKPSQQQPVSTPMHPQLQPQGSAFQPQQQQQSYAPPSQPSASTSTFGSGSMFGSGSTPANPPLNLPSAITNQFPTRSVSLPVMTGTNNSSPVPFAGQNLSLNMILLNTQPQGMGNPFAQPTQTQTHGFLPSPMQMQMQMPMNGTPAFQPSNSAPVVHQLSSSPFAHSPYTPTAPPVFPTHQQQQFVPSSFPQQYGQPSHMAQPIQAFPQQQQPMQGQGGNPFGTSIPAWQQQPAGQPPYGSWGGM